MIKRNYYYLVAYLPDLFSDEKKPPFSSVEFRNILRGELSKTDFESSELLFLPYDHKNLLNLLFKKDKKWDDRGNYDKETLDKVADHKSYELAEDLSLKPYLNEFLEQFYGEVGFDNYYTAELNLTAKYYDYLSENPSSFLKKIVENEKNIRNVNTTLTGRKHNLKFEDTLIGDDEITAALKKSRVRDFGLSDEVEGIENVVQIFEIQNPVDREYKLDQYIWNYLDEITFFNYFSIEKILAYIKKLFIAERWYELDKETGRNLFKKILKELQAGFKIPEEFTIIHGKKK